MHEQAHPTVMTPISPTRLVHGSEQFVVMPRIGDVDPFEPFALPVLPQSRLNSMAILLDRFHQLHGRCMAILFQFDPRQSAWCVRIPRQRCYADAVRWDLVVQDDSPEAAPGHLVATLQSLVAHEAETLNEHVPPIDGVHMMYDITLPDHRLHYFVRTEGVVHAVPPETIQGDDWHALLQINRDVMQLMD